jgi:putative FmdB family regulatory protein
MPTYQYRREDGTTFEIRQSFADAPLEIDPKTGQRVHRVIQPSGIIFKGSGFYVTDNKGSSRAVSASNNGNGDSSDSGSTETKSDAKTEAKSESKSETKSETKTETATAKASAD